MVKKGQITIFIVLGLIILIAAGLFYYTQTLKTGKGVEESVAVTANGIAVSQFIKGCIDTTAKSGVLLSGLQGGYTDVPPNFISTSYSDVPYYYDKGQVNVAKIEDFQNQIKRFMNANFKACINNFSTFTEKGVDVTAKSPIINVTINPATGMSVTMDYDVTIGSGDTQESLRRFSSNYDFRIGTLSEVAQKIVDRIVQEPKLIPMSYLTELNREYNVQIDSLSYGDDRIVYVIRDLSANVDGDTPLLFLFAARINATNSPPIINIDESKLTGRAGQEFDLTVNATDADYDLLEFSDDSDIFDIDTYGGEINFTPDAPGQYESTIFVTDGNKTVNKTIVINII